MASIMRPAVFRQAPAASHRMLSTLVRPNVARPLAQWKPAFDKSTPSAAFHASQRKQILPPLPQSVEGDFLAPAPMAQSDA
jgi:succinate dehydrogenase (ubiquinone) membrane anchor subunit